MVGCSEAGYTYYPGQHVFLCGVVGLYLADAYWRRGYPRASLEFLNYAQVILGAEKPQFLFPGIGTYLYRSALEKEVRMIGHLEPWKSATHRPMALITPLAAALHAE